MSGKLTLSIVDWKPLRKNTLVGFCAVRVAEMRLTVRDVAIHEKEGRRWAQLPSKAQIDRDGNTIRDQATRKIQYAALLLWDSRAVADAFSDALVRALLEKFADAFDRQKESASAR